MKYLDIDAIRSNLIDVQQHFSQINDQLSVKRSVPSDEAIENLVAGYSRIDSYLSENIDPFQIGNSYKLLELDQIVLFHSSQIREHELNAQFQATEEQFYEADNGGIGGLMKWLKMNANCSVWKKVAGVFCYIIAQPQLFIEGNHRVATLVASYLLVKEGFAPLVLTLENAHLFFEISEQIKQLNKNRFMDEFLAFPKLTNSFAEILEAEQSHHFVLAKHQQ